jgi:hypothetical protein
MWADVTGVKGLYKCCVTYLRFSRSVTSSCRSCHYAARNWLHWPPGPSNEAYLSSPLLEASPATTFRTCCSPAPTLVKPQPAPAILSQELVHTTLSITHHTRKRPSTGPRTTHGPQFREVFKELKTRCNSKIFSDYIYISLTGIVCLH